MILHIVKRGEWDEAVRRGRYAPESLRVEGFIHCSTRAQVIATANRFYRGQRDLVVVWIEEERVTAEVKWEAPVAPRNLTPDPFPRGKGDQIEDEKADGVAELSADPAEPSPFDRLRAGSILSREITGEAPERMGEASESASEAPERTGEASEIARATSERTAGRDARPTAEVFPHLYGALNVDAVVKVVELMWEEDRGFRIAQGVAG
jgi:uncharacterized protein (DUF952 family)